MPPSAVPPAGSPQKQAAVALKRAQDGNGDGKHGANQKPEDLIPLTADEGEELKRF